MMVLDKLFEKFEFNESTEFDIKEVNGIRLPDEYIKFMKKHDGGEGPVGINGYAVLWTLEELKELNDEYQAIDWPECVLFGSDGGDILFAYNQKNNKYCEIDACNIDDDTYFNFSDSFEEFISKISIN